MGTARKLRDEGVDFFACRCLLLFHPATGLHRAARSAWSSVEAWGAVIRRCRRQFRRAAKALKRNNFKPERSLVERCDEVERMGDDMEARCRAVWKLCSEKKPRDLASTPAHMWAAPGGGLERRGGGRLPHFLRKKSKIACKKKSLGFTFSE